MADKIFRIERENYTARSTVGDFFFPDSDKERFCYTLEDTVRPFGIKVKKETAIPATDDKLYRLSVSFSSRFQRMMPIIYTESDKVTLKKDGKVFVGARLHGGNTHENTEGCPLVAYKKINDDTIQGTAESAITAEIQRLEKLGHICYLKITNNPQEQ